jgi:hypothetical protein
MAAPRRRIQRAPEAPESFETVLKHLLRMRAQGCSHFGLASPDEVFALEKAVRDYGFNRRHNPSSCSRVL